jgi:hypothetical protein
MPTSTSTAVATTGVSTAAVLLLTDVLTRYHIPLSQADLGYVLLLANAAAHAVKPYAGALLAQGAAPCCVGRWLQHCAQ